MRKILKKSVVILAIFMCFSLLLGITSKLDWSVAKASIGDPGGYTNLTYQGLDDITCRSSVSALPTQITVFTHGLGGTPSHWSNQGNEIECGEYKFEYDAYSMPEQLRTKMEDNGQQVVMFTAKVVIEPLLIRLTKEEIIEKENEKNINLDEEDKKYYKTSLSEDEWGSEPVSDSITNQKAGPESHQALYKKYFTEEEANVSTGNEEPKCTQLVELKKRETTGYVSTGGISTNTLTADDVFKHIILIFEAVDTDGSNDYVYAQLEYILDVISYQYLQLRGVLPTYNLVAHSRGGLTNMQYALAHPYNVASLYSVGTPYNGSAFGSAALTSGLDKNHVFLTLAGYTRYDITYGNGESNFSPGVLNIIEPGLIESYKEYWNEHFQDYYSHINFQPMGTYVTAGFLVGTLLDFFNITNDDLDKWMIDLDEGEIFEALKNGHEPIGWEELLLNEETFLARLENVVKYIVRKVFSGEEEENWLTVVDNFQTTSVEYEHIGPKYVSTFVIKDDLFIDLDSQIALEYERNDDAEVKVCLMNARDQLEGRARKNVKAAGVGHNLEVRHPDIVNNIVNDLVDKNSEAIYNFRFAETGYYIVTMNKDGSNGGILNIPSTYKGLPIVGIDSLTRNIVIGGEETYHPSITKVVIPASVKYISDYAFYGMSHLQTVVFNGDEVHSMGIGAFMNCTSLTDVTLPQALNSIGNYTFFNCTSLRNITLPSSVTNLGTGAFSTCTNLSAVNFGQNSSLTSIGNRAFYGCSQLTSVNIPDSVKWVGSNAFYNTGIWNNAQNNSIVYADTWCLGYKGEIENATLEAGTIGIAERAFAGNSNLSSVSLPNSLQYIGGRTFANCTSLANVNFNSNNNLTGIGNRIFYGCTNLTSINIPASVEWVDSNAFYNTGFWNNAPNNSIVYADTWCLGYKGEIEDATLKAGTKGIADGVFAGCDNLSSVNFPNSLLYIGDNAFLRCGNLEIVTFTGNGQLKRIGAYAFSETGLKNIEIPSTVTEIGMYAFASAPNLTSIVIPGMVTDIGEYAVTGESGNNAGQVTIYTESSQSLSGWAEYWNAFADYSAIIEDLNNGTYNSNDVDKYYQRRPVFWGCVLSADKKYVVSFTKQDGSITDSDAPNGINSPYRVGYVFEGWYASQTFEGASYTSAQLVTAPNGTYYAKWMPIETYSITYKDVGNTEFSGRDTWGFPTTHIYGTVTALEEPYKEGYSFVGWYMNSNGTGTKFTSIPGSGYNYNITLYAKWEVETYTITYVNVWPDCLDGRSPTTHTYGEETVLYDPVMEGFTFGGWYTNSGYEGTGITVLEATGYTSNINLHAKWICNNGYADIYFVDYLLITDDSSGVYLNYFKEYGFADVHFVGAPSSFGANDFENILSMYEYSGILFYATTQDFLAGIQVLGESEIELNVPCVVATNLLLEDGQLTMFTFMRDDYSMGYNIANTYVNSLMENDVLIMDIIQGLYEDLGYFPIVAGDGTKYNTLMLMGMSDVLGAPVKVLYEGEILDELNSYDYTEFNYWLFVDATQSCLNYFQNPNEFYFFGYDEATIAQFLLINNNVYAIREKMGYLQELATNMSEGIEVAAYTLEPWVFVASGDWLGMRHYVENGSVHNDCWALWTELNYPVNEEKWNFYKNSALAIAGEEVSGIDSSVDDWDSYFEAYKICYIEVVVVKIP